MQMTFSLLAVVDFRQNTTQRAVPSLADKMRKSLGEIALNERLGMSKRSTDHSARKWKIKMKLRWEENQM